MRRIFLSALAIVGVAGVAAAQTSPTTRLIPYAGSALDDRGRPLSGSVAVAFELYEEQDGGAPLWRETQHVTADARGAYLVYLGATTPLPQAAFSEERARWLASQGAWTPGIGLAHGNRTPTDVRFPQGAVSGTIPRILVS